MNDFFIVKASIADSDAITHLVNGAYRPQKGFEGWTHESDWVDGNRIDESLVLNAIHSTCVLLAKQPSNVSLGDVQQLLGCVQIEIAQQKAYIGMFAVWPQWQGKGLGSQLFSAALSYAKKSECVQASVFVVNKRTDLIQYYERRGFVQTGNLKQYPIGEGVGVPKDPEQLLLVELSTKL